MDNTRNIVLNMLLDTLEKGEFSHIVLSRTLAEKSLDPRDKAFVNRLYAGTLEKLVYLDYVLNCYSSVKVRKMKPVIRNLLRMSVYQLRFMDAVPDRACIYEAVNLAGKRGFRNLGGFVNALLRKISVSGEENLPLPVRLSVPDWIYDLIAGQYTKERANAFFEAVQKEKSGTIVRMNLAAWKRDDILRQLQEEHVQIEPFEQPDSALRIYGFDSLTGLKAFQKGMIIMQDISSMMAVLTAASHLQDPQLILDVCAAPGGKSLFLAEKFPASSVVARDLTAYKTGLIEENISRLKIKNVRTQVFDARVEDPSMIGKADAVIADLPCSGLGVLGRKPDIMYRLKPEDLPSLKSLQREILSVVSGYVKPEGILVFSTCTVNRQENEENTAWILQNGDFTLLDEKLYLPGRDASDGFYIACLQRK